MINLDKTYRNIYILDSRNYWTPYAKSFDPCKDLILTFDFGLKYKVKGLGGDAFYIDNLCAPTEMQKNNFLAAEFFKKWHFDKNNNDIFTSQGVPFGFAFRIEIWSEYLYYVRLRANLAQLKNLKFQTIYVGETGGVIAGILDEIGINFIAQNELVLIKKLAYYFDIHKYMVDALRGSGIRMIARNFLVCVLSNISFHIDSIFNIKRIQKTIYVQNYYPTIKIIEHLQKDSNLRVVTPSLIPSKGLKKYFVQRLIPIRGHKAQFQKHADVLLDNFRTNRSVSLHLSDGTDITAGTFKIIEKKIQQIMPEALQILDSVIYYIKKHPVHLEIMIANIGLVQTIVDSVLKSRKIQSYLIINGILGGKFSDEGKYANYINCYSENIKKHYFSDATNVVCLGDPRMDYFSTKIKLKTINRKMPTISIGASGFNGINLISHAAVEFDFLFDILTAFVEIKNEGDAFHLVIKVRANGVLEQYNAFVAEYFPELNVEIVREIPIGQVLARTDLYISIYSQTLFEASCLGIPTIYYKKDKEYLDPPFDGESELVTVDTVCALKQAFIDFKAGDARFDAFLEKTVMEKYIGPLDGKNLERNLAYIYDLLNNAHPGEVL